MAPRKLALLLTPALLALGACTGTPSSPGAVAPPEIAATLPAPAELAHWGIGPAQLTPEYWIAQRPDAQRVLATPATIAAQNARLRALGPGVQSLDAMPAALEAGKVRSWIEGLSRRPTRALFDENGAPVTTAELDALLDALALERIPPLQTPRFGLVTRRVELRTFPTARRVFDRAGETDIDRFQESAFFPGTPLAVVHADRSGQWLFAVGEFYSAWLPLDAVAIGERAAVLDYARRAPALYVHGAQVRTVHTREAPALSERVLDMGARLPLQRDWPIDEPVNGQGTLAAHVIEMPLRDAGGALRLAPALLPRAADVGPAPLAFSEANLLRQAFKFLGERYGWGHAYGARDCSGFVSEVYRSLGIELPRNTRDQARSSAFERREFAPALTRAERLALLRGLEVGDLVYVPGHVMMVIGQRPDGPWVIHDTNGGSLRGADGALRRLPANGVVVTPLLPLGFGPDRDMLDAITVVQRIRPGNPE